jgi:hypothetical protein
LHEPLIGSVFRIDWRTGRRESASDQSATAISDHKANFFGRKFAPPHLAQHLIQARPQVEKAIHKSAIQIKEKRGAFHQLSKYALLLSERIATLSEIFVNPEDHSGTMI